MNAGPTVSLPDLRALQDFVERDAALRAVRNEVAARLDDDPGHDLHHALRVALAAVRIGATLEPPVPARLAVAAALLHDVVNVPKDSPDRARASELCAAEARRILPAHGFGGEEIELVAGAIRDHSFSRRAIPETPLGNALQDADRLEALGAIGLMRCISTGVRMNARYFHEDDPFAHDRPLDDRRYSVDHFYAKLLGLPATFRTSAGRAEAERRAAFLRTFLTQLATELGHGAR